MIIRTAYRHNRSDRDPGYNSQIGFAQFVNSKSFLTARPFLRKSLGDRFAPVGGKPRKAPPPVPPRRSGKDGCLPALVSFLHFTEFGEK